MSEAPATHDPNTLVVRMHCNGFTGYGQHMVALGRMVEKQGYKIEIDCIDASDSLLPVPGWIGPRRVGSPPGPLLQSTMPGRMMREGDVQLTMWESTRILPSGRGTSIGRGW